MLYYKMLRDTTQIYIGTIFQGHPNNTYTILMCVPFSTAIPFQGIYPEEILRQGTCVYVKGNSLQHCLQLQIFGNYICAYKKKIGQIIIWYEIEHYYSR